MMIRENWFFYLAGEKNSGGYPKILRSYQDLFGVCLYDTYDGGPTMDNVYLDEEIEGLLHSLVPIGRVDDFVRAAKFRYDMYNSSDRVMLVTDPGTKSYYVKKEAVAEDKLVRDVLRDQIRKLERELAIMNEEVERLYRVYQEEGSSGIAEEMASYISDIHTQRIIRIQGF